MRRTITALILCMSLTVHAGFKMGNFITKGQARNGNTDNLVVSLPSTIAVDDMIFVAVSRGFADHITDTTGWTVLVGGGSDSQRHILYKFATVAGAQSVSLAFSASVRGSMGVTVFRGVAKTSTINVSGTATALAASLLSFPQPTSTIDGCLIHRLCFYFSASSGDTAISISPGQFGGGYLSTGASGFSSVISSYETQVSQGLVSSGTAVVSGGSGVADLYGYTYAIRSYAGPTTPTVIFTNGGESLIEGASINLTCTDANSPTATPSSLEYEFSYTVNGTDYTTLALTAPGVKSKALTVPSVLTSLFRVRVRAYDPAVTLYSLDYDYSDGFASIVAETAPPAPTINLPVSGAFYNKAAPVTIAWTYGGGLGNPKTESTILWSNDNFVSDTHTVVVSGAAVSTTIDFSAQASGATISIKIKDKGLSLYSVYSAVRQFIVATLPATPTITAPTTVSPPAIPKPTITFTESDTFIARRMRVAESGIQVYDSGAVSSTALSFASPYRFKNGVPTVLYLSIENPYGLFSAEASQAFTPSFSSPDEPTLIATPVNSTESAGGYMNLQISNPATGPQPDSNDIYKFQVNTMDALLMGNGDFFLLPDGGHLLLPDDPTGAIRIATGVPVNGAFQDHHVASGVTYKYFAEAVIEATELTTDSATESAGVTLTLLHVHAVLTGDSDSNALNPVALMNPPPAKYQESRTRPAAKMLGRGVATASGLIARRSLSVGSTIMLYADQSQFDAFMSVYRSSSVHCIRDQGGNLLFGKITALKTVKTFFWEIAFEFVESKFDEEI